MLIFETFKDIQINPFVSVIDNFISDETCNEIIKLAQEKGMNRSGVGDDGANPQYDYRRTSSGVFINFNEKIIWQV